MTPYKRVQRRRRKKFRAMVRTTEGDEGDQDHQ
jgi:hypothetical protein